MGVNIFFLRSEVFLLECLFGRLFATVSTDWTSASNYAFFNASIELLETNNFCL